MIAGPPPPMLQSWTQLSDNAGNLVRNERRALLTGSWLLGLLALASVAVLVGGRMAGQLRRVGLLKAVGATPGLVASVLLAEYVVLALIAAAAGLAIGRLAAPPLEGVRSALPRPRSHAPASTGRLVRRNLIRTRAAASEGVAAAGGVSS